MPTLSEVQNACRVRGRTDHDHVNDEQEQEPQGGEADGPQKRRDDGLMSYPRQKPSWEKRSGWGKVTMISRGVEISVTGGEEEMVPAISWSTFFLFSFLFLYQVLLVKVKVQELTCMVRYGVRKTLIPTTACFTSSWEQSNTPNP